MSIIYLLLPIALLMGFGFLAAFIHASYAGQYDDLETPAHRMLLDDEFQIVKNFKKTPETNQERNLHVV
jgi:cbb3-type cytochrome oxidase maturation protein